MQRILLMVGAVVCLTAAAFNCDGEVDIADLTHLSSCQFNGGPPPCDQCP